MNETHGRAEQVSVGGGTLSEDALGKRAESAISIGGGLIGGGAGIWMLVQVLLTNNSVLAQHGEEFLRVNHRIDDVAEKVQDYRGELNLLRASMKAMDARIVGRGPEGFHKQDWERERRVVDAKFSQIDLLLQRFVGDLRECQRQLKSQGPGG